MPLGIMQSSLDSSDLERSFALAQQAGAEGLEVTCSSPHDAKELLSSNGAKWLMELSARHGLKVPSLALGVLCRSDWLGGPGKTLAEAMETVLEAICNAPEAGVGVLLLPFFGKAAIESEQRLERLILLLPELAEPAEKAGLTLGIESTLNGHQQLYLLESLAGFNSVRIYYDTGNMLARRLDPATCLRELGRAVCQIHFKDVRINPEGGPPQWDVPLGQGNVDFKAVANAMVAIGFAGWAILETPGGADPVASAKANLEFTRQLLR